MFYQKVWYEISCIYIPCFCSPCYKNSLIRLKITLCSSLVLDALLLTLNSALTKKKVTEKTNQTLIKLITFCRSGGKVGKIARLMYLSVIDMTSRSLVSRWKSHFKALTRTPLEGGLYNYSCYRCLRDPTKKCCMFKV